jgi:VWFA-related protein
MVRQAVAIGCVVVGVSGGLVAADRPIGAASAQAQTFRTRIDLARVDVTVVETRTGRPINDLTQADFSISEDGVRQTITAFAKQAIVAEPAADMPTEATARTVQSGPLAPKSRRVFLLVLGHGGGRGGLSYGLARHPVRAFDGLLEFLRTRLLPQDLVSVMAFNRATEFTSDANYLIRVIERVRAATDTINFELFKTRQIPFGPFVDVTEPVQAVIDGVFRAPESAEPHPRSVPSLLMATGQARTADPGRPVPWNRSVIFSDILKTYAGVEYLRHLEGEKHIVTLTYSMQPGGFMSKDANVRIARRAGDAQVAINIIGVGGTFTNQGMPGTSVGTHPFDSMSSNTMTELSGGQYSSLRYVADQLGRIDEASRTGYILGYVPTNGVMDGKYRDVKVTVNRPNVTVLYRRGYTASDRAAVMDLRQVMTSERLMDAASSVIESRDIKVEATAAVLPGKDGPGHVRVEMEIDPSRLTLAFRRGRHTGVIDIAVFCGDARQQVVCAFEDQWTLSLDATRYEAAQRDGIPYSTTIPLTGRPTYVKVVVYDYEADLVGTAVVKTTSGVVFEEMETRGSVSRKMEPRVSILAKTTPEVVRFSTTFVPSPMATFTAAAASWSSIF